MAEEAGQDGAVQSETVRIGKRCFVGNLAYRTSWQDLKDKFRECGTVVYTNVMQDDSGHSKCWGIVEFTTPEEALHAINTMNGQDLGGRRLQVREDREDRDIKSSAPHPPRQPRAPSAHHDDGGEGGRGSGGRGRGRGRGRGAERAPPPQRTGESSGFQVVIQGIPWSWTSEEVKNFFSQVDTVESAEVAMSFDGRSRGYATARFMSTEAAAAAVQKFHNYELEGRTVAVFLDKYA